jgi:nucleoside-diphosphate-sugar epimerase
MRILILGGTLFLGRHLVEAALGRGHEVTLFNRGRTIRTSSRTSRSSEAIAQQASSTLSAGAAGTP